MNSSPRGWKRAYFTIWSGQAISIFTSAILQMAIVWYLTDRTGSAAVLALATFVGFIPQGILGPFIGVYVDRYDRKKIMIFADAFIAASSLFIVFFDNSGEIPISILLWVLFVRSIGAAFHQPSIQAVTPAIVPEDSLTQCAGYSQAIESVSLILSPAVAAFLYGAWGLNLIVLLDVAGAVLAIITLVLSKIPRLPQRKEKMPNVLREAKEGFLILQRNSGLVWLVAIGAFYAMIYFPIGNLYPLITMTYFGGSFAQSGLIETLFSAGTLAGSIWLGLVGKRLKKMSAIGKSIGVMGIGLLATGMLPPSGFPAFTVLSLLMGLSTPFYYGVQTAIFQTQVDSNYLGRVLSLSSSLGIIAMPVGLGLSGVFAQLIGINRWFFISGIVTLILALLCFSIPALRNCCSAHPEEGKNECKDQKLR